MPPTFVSFFDFILLRLRACVTKCRFCHIRLPLSSAADGECRHPANSPQGFCGRAVCSALAAALRFAAARLRRCLCRSAPLRPLHPLRRLWRDGLTKPAFCRRSPLIFAAVAAAGRSLRSLRAAVGGTFKPPAAAELCRPQLAAVWLAVPPRAASEVTVKV